MKDHKIRQLELLLSIHISNFDKMSEAHCNYEDTRKRINELQRQYKEKMGYEFVYVRPERKLGDKK